jgi:hypothetical protein
VIVLRKISGRVRGEKSSENDRKIWKEFIKAHTFAIHLTNPEERVRKNGGQISQRSLKEWKQ